MICFKSWLAIIVGLSTVTSFYPAWAEEVPEYSRRALETSFPEMTEFFKPVKLQNTPKLAILRHIHSKQIPQHIPVGTEIIPELLFETAWYQMQGSPQIEKELNHTLQILSLKHPTFLNLKKQLTQYKLPQKLLETKVFGQLWKTTTTMNYMCKTEQWTSCLQNAQLLVEQAKRLNLTSALAQALYYQGWSHWKRDGSTAQALKFWAQSRQQALQIGDQRLEFELQGQVGVLLDQFVLVKQALEKSKVLKDDWLTAQLLFLQVQVPGMAPYASHLYDQAFKQSAALPELFMSMDARFKLIFEIRAHQNYSYITGSESHPFLSELTKLAAFYEPFGFSVRLGPIYLRMSQELHGMSEKDGGGLEKALAALHKALKHAEKVQDPKLKGDVQATFGAYLEKSQPQEALAWLSKAETSYHKLPVQEGEPLIQQLKYYHQLYAHTSLMNEAQRLEQAGKRVEAKAAYWQIYNNQSKHAQLAHVLLKLFPLDPEKVSVELLNRWDELKQSNEFSHHFSDYQDLIKHVQNFPHPSLLPVSVWLMTNTPWQWSKTDGLSLYRALGKSDWQQMGLSMIKREYSVHSGNIPWLDEITTKYLELPGLTTQTQKTCLHALSQTSIPVRYFCLNLLAKQKPSILNIEQINPLLTDPEPIIRNQALTWLITHQHVDFLGQLLDLQMAGKKFDAKLLSAVIQKHAKPHHKPLLEACFKSEFEANEYGFDNYDLVTGLLATLAMLDSDQGWTRLVQILETDFKPPEPIEVKDPHQAMEWRHRMLENFAIQKIAEYPPERSKVFLRTRLSDSNEQVRNEAWKRLMIQQDSTLAIELLAILRHTDERKLFFWAIAKLEKVVSPEEFWLHLLSQQAQRPEMGENLNKLIWLEALHHFPQKGLGLLQQMETNSESIRISEPIYLPIEPPSVFEKWVHPNAGLLLIKMYEKGLLHWESLSFWLSHNQYIWPVSELDSLSLKELEILFLNSPGAYWLSGYQDPGLKNWLAVHMNTASEPLKTAWKKILEASN